MDGGVAGGGANADGARMDVMQHLPQPEISAQPNPVAEMPVDKPMQGPDFTQNTPEKVGFFKGVFVFFSFSFIFNIQVFFLS